MMVLVFDMSACSTTTHSNLNDLIITRIASDCDVNIKSAIVVLIANPSCMSCYDQIPEEIYKQIGNIKSESLIFVSNDTKSLLVYARKMNYDPQCFLKIDDSILDMMSDRSL
jgi:type III secretion system FlhB-like substrate exporter